jgi:hypothetical protein
VRCRNALIGEAAKIANELTGTGNGAGWTRHFAIAMEELAKRCL